MKWIYAVAAIALDPALWYQVNLAADPAMLPELLCPNAADGFKRHSAGRTCGPRIEASDLTL